MRALNKVTSTASESISVAMISRFNAFAAAIASIPAPQPKSNTLFGKKPSFSNLSNSIKHPFVVP